MSSAPRTQEPACPAEAAVGPAELVRESRPPRGGGRGLTEPAESRRAAGRTKDRGGSAPNKTGSKNKQGGEKSLFCPQGALWSREVLRESGQRNKN